MRKIARRVGALTVLLLAATSLSEAAAVRSGATVPAILALTRGSAVAYDPINHVYLVVSAQGLVQGRFVSPNGTPLGAQFPIQTHPGNFGAYPRVGFSPDANGGAGGFLVTWAEADILNNASLHGRMVAFGQSGAYGVDTQLSVDGTWWEAGSYIAYSTTSQEFLVVYRMNVSYIIRAVRVDNNAAAKDAIFSVSATSQYEDNPSVAYNPTTNQFLVSWKGYNDPGKFGFVETRRVQAGSNQLLGVPVRLFVAAAAYITDTTYNSRTNQFLVTWDSGVNTGILGRLVNADGTLPGTAFPISTRYHAYDALGVGYNPVSRTFFMTSHDATGSVEDGGVELNDTGVPVDNGFLVTAAGGRGNFYPSISASTEDPNWLVATSASFANTSVQLVTGTPVEPPPPPVSNPAMVIDTPQSGFVSPSFWLAGWGLDLGSPTGAGADAVHVWAWPDSGAPPIFAGAVVPGMISRPDVGAAFGSRFTPSGWGLVVNNLPGGTYTVVAYLHSTVSSSFSLYRAVRVTVADPLMSIDTPTPNANVSHNGFMVGGWALDRGATSGTGVDTLHMWAWPTSGGSPMWAGVATYGGVRPDLGAIVGPQFTNCGFNALVTLPPGQYDLAVYSHSSVTGSFSTARLVRINVQ